jgi:hypothetical protein
MKNWLLATSLFAVLSGTAQAQIPTPCTCPKTPYGSGNQGGVQVYYYYSLKCPGNVPHMYVSTVQFNQFSGICQTNPDQCGGAVVVPLDIPTGVRTTPLQASKVDIQKSHRWDDATRNWEIERESLSLLGLKEIPTASDYIEAPQLNEALGGTVGSPLYFKITVNGRELLLKGFQIVLDASKSPTLTKRLDAAGVPAGNGRMITAGIAFQFASEAGEEFQSATTISNVELIDPQPEKLPNRNTKFDTRAIHFQHNGVAYVGILGTTLHSR